MLMSGYGTRVQFKPRLRSRLLFWSSLEAGLAQTGVCGAFSKSRARGRIQVFMASARSGLSSQTPREHEELLKYEYNLASCYEAEYLLSLKLQEDMMRSRGGSGSSSGSSSSRSSSECYYDDVYETQHPPPQTSVPSRGVSCGVEVMDTDSTSSLSSCNHPTPSTGVGLATHLPQVPLVACQYAHTNGHPLSVSLMEAPDSCRNRAESAIGEYHQSNGEYGYSVMADSINWSSHIEGPARKK